MTCWVVCMLTHGFVLGTIGHVRERVGEGGQQLAVMGVVSFFVCHLNIQTNLFVTGRNQCGAILSVFQKVKRNKTPKSQMFCLTIWHIKT